MRELSYTLGCTFVGCDLSDTIEIDDDMSESEIHEMLYEMALEFIQPEGCIDSIEVLDD
jgi:hypothetical protein